MLYANYTLRGIMNTCLILLQKEYSMEILVGVSWLFYWLLQDSFNVTSLKAALITGVVFILVGLLIGYGPRYLNRNRA